MSSKPTTTSGSAPVAASKPVPGGANSPRAEPDVDPEKVASPDLAREEMVRFTGRGYTDIRHVFVQKHSGTDRSSTLARLLRNKKRRALILYLMLLTLWDPKRGPHRSEVWLRLLDVTGGTMTWSPSSLSEAWTHLADVGLIERKRVKRMAHVVPQREDARKAYERPDGKKRIDRYFQLPGAFWTDKWFDALSMPALCMLLIILKETNDNNAEIHLTHEQVEEWYGISASSAAAGFAELEAAGLVSVRRDQVKAGLSTKGYTWHLYYSLNGDFSTAARAEARDDAKKRGEERAAAKKSATKSAAKRPAKEAGTSKAGATKTSATKASARPVANEPVKKSTTKKRG